MLHKLRNRAEDEKGFTLIELLVVILIIAILAAVAIPTFLNQRGKAYDSNAQSFVKDMQTAEETFATGDNGTYATSLAQLQGVDASLSSTGSGQSVSTASVAGGGTTADAYTVTATANNTGDAFTITESNGTANYTCTAASGSGTGAPGACQSGSW